MCHMHMQLGMFILLCVYCPIKLTLPPTLPLWAVAGCFALLPGFRLQSQKRSGLLVFFGEEGRVC